MNNEWKGGEYRRLLIYMRKENVKAKRETKWQYSTKQYSKWTSQSLWKSITGFHSSAVFIGQIALHLLKCKWSITIVFPLNKVSVRFSYDLSLYNSCNRIYFNNSIAFITWLCMCLLLHWTSVKLSAFYLISYVYWIILLLLSFITSVESCTVICIKLDR